MNSQFSLIPVYAGFGDTLLVRTKEGKLWLIDGGPVTMAPGAKVQADVASVPYYQYLQAALRRYCTDKDTKRINKLDGIVVTHPDGDHVQGIIRLLEDWLYHPGQTSDERPLDFDGPVIMTDLFLQKGRFNLDKNFKDRKLSVHLQKQKFSVVDLNDFKEFYDTNHISKIIPDEMLNNSETQICVMIRRKGRYSKLKKLPKPSLESPKPSEEAYYELEVAELEAPNFAVDSSIRNRLSIDSRFTNGNGNDLDLFTTGDGVARNIASRLPASKNVHIFKVPHHGSKSNSLVDYAPPRDLHSDLAFVLAMLVWRYAPRNRILDPNEAVFEAASEARKLLYKVYFADLKNRFASSPKVRIVVDQSQLESLLDMLQEETRKYWSELGTKIQLGEKESFQSLSLDGNHKTTKSLIKKIWGRLEREENRILTGGKTTQAEDIKFSPAKTKTTMAKSFYESLPAESKGDETDYLKSETWRFTFEENHVARLRTATKIKKFYDSFSAQNYVISANGRHGHPNDELLAGIISSVLTRKEVGKVRRIFVTTGYAVRIDHVIDLVQKVLSINPIPLATWKDFVGIYSFYDDFLAEIPTDAKHVANCVLIPFVPPGIDLDDPQDTQLRYLEHAFNASLPSNIPRARVSWKTQFRLSVVDSKGKVVSHLGLNGQGHLIHQPLDTPDRAVFSLEVENRPLKLSLPPPSPELSVYQYAMKKLLPNQTKQFMVSPAKLAVYLPRLNQKHRLCLVYGEDGKQLMEPNIGADKKPLEKVEFKEPVGTKSTSGRVLFEQLDVST